MYQLGHRHHRKRAIYTLVPIVVVVLGSLFFVAKHTLRQKTVITQASAVVTTVKATTSPHKQFAEGNFALSLPQDWKYIGRDAKISYHPYVWQNTAENPGVRELRVYEDAIPVDLAVNRLLPVQAEGNHLNPGAVSDNCTSFTGTGDTQKGAVTGKWGGVDFICDTQNYERDVVGTGSVGGLNKVTLIDSSAGNHNFFFTYTDNSAQPDYTIFTNALASFKLK